MSEKKDRSREAYPRNVGARSKGKQGSGYQRTRTATVDVGMNTPLLSLPVSAPIPEAIKKKRVLLIDTSHAKRDLRAEPVEARDRRR